MGLRAKFNLMLLGVALAGIALFALASTPVLNDVAKNEVEQNSRIMMDSALGARQYTSQEIAPLLAPDMAKTFHPQSVSAYAAKKNFAVLKVSYPDYSYREAALNPTNPEDLANDWESDIIGEFRENPKLAEVITERSTPAGETLNLARPLAAPAACLSCHSTPQAAPKSMIAIYGPDHGFGWKENEIIGAQIVSVPMSVALDRANQVRLLFLGLYAGVFVALFLLLNLLLDFVVIGPIDKMTKTSEAVSMGQMDAPEYQRGGKDQIARLSTSINRMRRSLQEALRMLTEG
jgi:HAMP domain-containing protein